jgi:hypothetical protein
MNINRLRLFFVATWFAVLCCAVVFLGRYVVDPTSVNLAPLLLAISIFVVVSIYAVYLYRQVTKKR